VGAGRQLVYRKKGITGKRKDQLNVLIEAALKHTAAAAAGREEEKGRNNEVKEIDRPKSDTKTSNVAPQQGEGNAVLEKRSEFEGQGAGMGPDQDPLTLVGAPGKKLRRKDRKLLKKKDEAAKRRAEDESAAARASAEGAQFACSQTAVDENNLQWKNSLDVNIPSFGISAAGKILLNDATLRISQGRRYGLVAPNGKGKSTLLKMIASQKLKIPPRIDCLYVEQEVVADDTPAIDAVLRADTKLWALLEEEKTLEEELHSGDDVCRSKVERLLEIHEQLRSMGADASEGKARKILHGLGFDEEMQSKATKMFSGGWRMRISLAKALFVEPTLLMLDEPTNHLDLNAVIWLDDYLQSWKKILLVVSHDQDFMNSVCEEILHIEDLKLISYRGNYDSFKAVEKTKLMKQTKAWSAQQKQTREQKKGKGSAKTTWLVKRPREYKVNMEFAEVAALSGPVLEVIEVCFHYSATDPVLFHKINFGIGMDSRMCVVGLNGCGKTTLLKLISGQVAPTKGEVKRNPRLRMGIYNQHFVDVLPMNKTPVEFLREKHRDENYQSVCKILGTYGLERHAHEITMRDLSGGQKARVVFADLTLQRPHLLLLDEPTNNLDVETIDALVYAIKGFNGGVVVVTHDQRLIDQCGCALWIVENQGVTRWEASFKDYKEMLLSRTDKAIQREEETRLKRREIKAAARAEKLAAIELRRSPAGRANGKLDEVGK
jgi:ATP-binding cassette subfamily F protein 1